MFHRNAGWLKKIDKRFELQVILDEIFLKCLLMNG